MDITMVPPKPRIKNIRRFILCIVLLLAAGFILCNFFISGKLTLKNAHILERSISLTAEVPGVIATVSAEKGNIVAMGSLLVTLNQQQYTASLKEAEAHLAAMEALLPPGYGKKEGSLTSEETLYRLQEDEQNARKVFEESSAAEAQAGVTKARRQSLYAAGKVSNQDVTAATHEYENLRSATQKNKELYERKSLARAAVEKEISRLKKLQVLSGVDSLPAKARIKAYEAQLANVELAAANLDSAFIKAPSEGTVLDIFVEPGQSVEAGSPVIVFQPAMTNIIIVQGELTAKKALNVYINQECEVSIPSLNLPAPLPCRVAMIAPIKDSKSTEIRVVVKAEGQTEPVVPGASAKVVLLDADDRKSQGQ